MLQSMLYNQLAGNEARYYIENCMLQISDAFCLYTSLIACLCMCINCLYTHTHGIYMHMIDI
jgi:hypothetical protein